MFPWLVLIFRDKWNGARVILYKCPWKPICRNMDTILPLFICCVTKFDRPTALIFQCKFKCRMFLAKYYHRNVICEESSCTMTWYEEKTDVKRAWCILRTVKNSPLNILFWGVQYIKCVCYVCFAAQIWFCCENDKWSSEVKNGLVRK